MADCLVHPELMRRNHLQQPSHFYPHSLQGVSRGGKYGSMSGGSSLSQSMRYAESWLYGGGGGMNGRASLFGTVRATSRSRPRMLLAEDPYQAMRKSRLVMGTTSPVRKSILECDVDPYRLIADGDDTSGEDDLRLPAPSTKSSPGQAAVKVTGRSTVNGSVDLPKRPPRTRHQRPQNPSEQQQQNAYLQKQENQPKGILKKEARTSSVTCLTSVGSVQPPPAVATRTSVARTSFKEYRNRKKKQVQFNMEPDRKGTSVQQTKSPSPPPPSPSPPPASPSRTTSTMPLVNTESESSNSDSSASGVNVNSSTNGSVKLKRSLSDLRPGQRASEDFTTTNGNAGANKGFRIGFMDTMRLRHRPSRPQVGPTSVKTSLDNSIPDRPSQPPPPPPPPRHIFPFTKQQLENINKNRPANDCIKVLTLSEPVVQSRPKENHDSGVVKLVVPYHQQQQEEIKTVVSVGDDLKKPTAPPLPLAPKPNRSSVVIGAPAPFNKLTININGFSGAGDKNKPEETYSNGITVNGEESGKTLLVVDHVSELRNILNGEVEMKRLVKQQVDPVKAARNNMVPHVCGREPKEVAKSGGVAKSSPNTSPPPPDLIGDSVREIEKIGSELSSSTLSYESESDKGYEASEPSSSSDSSEKTDVYSSDLYRDKDKLVDEVEIRLGLDYDSSESHYETIRDPIYEEIPEEPPPLPLSPPPSSSDHGSSAIAPPAVPSDQHRHHSLLNDLITASPTSTPPSPPTKSIFEGATKYDILNYLAGAKERVIADTTTTTVATTEEESSVCSASPAHSRVSSLDYGSSRISQTSSEYSAAYSRISQLSSASDSSEESGVITSSAEVSLIDEIRKSSEVERNDSGVGSETSCRSRWQNVSNGLEDQLIVCEDCDQPVENQIPDTGGLYCLVCRKCSKRRTERREIITEIVETEEKYGRDLAILMDEFYRPMLVAGLLSQDQLSAIFLNSEELQEHNATLAEKLRDALEIALEQGDEDLLTVNIGAIFIEAAPMLHAFQSYCTRQGAAAMLLAGLEKEKELLRIFLRVSQMENAVLRRMNLNSFLMVPVQRVTKYPLLLSRLYKVTPHHIVGRELIKQAQQTIALHLDHINYLTKDISSTKLWRRISVTNGKKCGSEAEMINIKLRKIVVDVLDWNVDEVRFTIEGKLLYTQPTDNNWKRRATIKLVPVNAILVTLGKPTENYQGDNNQLEQDSNLLFPKTNGIKEASLVLLREKSGRYSLVREPLFLDRCIVCAETDVEEYFEVQELPTKDTYIFKAEDNESTKRWYRQLQYHAQGLGTWRKRRNALANIMINGMLLRT